MRGLFRVLTSFCLLASVIMSLCHGNSVQSSLAEDVRQEIAALAARIIKIIMSNTGTFYNNGKRNAGTVDSLYTLPDLLGVGRR